MDHAYDRRQASPNTRVALDIGRGIFTEYLKLHRYNGSLVVTDMENVGKRGKKVRELTVIPKTMNSQLEDKILKQAAQSIMDMRYDQAKAHLESILDRESHGELFELHEVVKRAIDVEPAGTKINLDKKFPDGSTIELTASPHDFMVKSRVPMGGGDKPSFHQDTLYSPAKKQDAILFFAWVKTNLSAVGNMTIMELRDVWDKLGVRYTYH